MTLGFKKKEIFSEKRISDTKKKIVPFFLVNNIAYQIIKKNLLFSNN